MAFVDEIFKANSAILNTLLTILNERLFDNGATRVRVPLLCLVRMSDCVCFVGGGLVVLLAEPSMVRPGPMRPSPFSELQVGASNELPESEELDALYDRFLLRRQVSQVSPAGLLEMLACGGAEGGGGAAAAVAEAAQQQLHGQAQAAALRSPGDPAAARVAAAAAPPLLNREDFERTRAAALASVAVPPAVLHLISDLRSYLQDKCEPPVYVSDRRLVKAVALMQVRARALLVAGRSRGGSRSGRQAGGRAGGERARSSPPPFSRRQGRAATAGASALPPPSSLLPPSLPPCCRWPLTPTGAAACPSTTACCCSTCCGSALKRASAFIPGCLTH